MHVFWPLFYLFLCHGDRWTWALLEMADNLLLCMGKAFPPRSRECVYLLTLRQGHSLARDGDRKKGRELEREEEWRESSRGMESKGICNANGCPATLNNSKCWMEILLFWSPVINFCRSGPFSFGLFWPMHLPFCTTSSSFPLLSLSLTLSRLYFRSCPLYLSVFRKKKKNTFSLCVFIEAPPACCPPVSLSGPLHW